MGISISLKALAESHSAEIAEVQAGIDGLSGRPLWTSTMRPTQRKDDPPEDEQD